MTTLADLLTAAKQDHGGWRVYTERSGLSPAVFHKLERGQNAGFPEPETITGLATALRMSKREVIIAAAEGLGFDMTDDSSQLGRLLPKAVDRLPERSKRALLEMALSIVVAVLGDEADEVSNVATTARNVRRKVDAATKKLAMGE